MPPTHLVAYIIVFWDFQRNIFEVIMYANFFFTIKIELSKSKLKSTMILKGNGEFRGFQSFNEQAFHIRTHYVLLEGKSLLVISQLHICVRYTVSCILCA